MDKELLVIIIFTILSLAVTILSLAGVGYMIYSAVEHERWRYEYCTTPENFDNNDFHYVCEGDHDD